MNIEDLESMREGKSGGYVKPHGEGRRRTYTLVEGWVEDTPGSSTESSTQSAPSSTQSAPSSTQSDTSSTQSPPSAIAESASHVSSSQWAPAPRIRRAILSLCEGRWLTIQDLAQALNRNQRTVRDNYLRSMVLEGLLERRYPQINHPAQAYRTLDGSTSGEASR